MLLMVEKGIGGGTCHAVHWYVKANSKYMKDYDKNKKSANLKSWDVNNLYGWAMLLKLPVNSFKWVGNTFKFNEDFIKSYNENSNEEYFLKLMFNIQKNCMNFIMIFHFYQKEGKLRKLKNLHDKKEYVIHIKNLKQTLSHEFVLKKVHRV